MNCIKMERGRHQRHGIRGGAEQLCLTFFGNQCELPLGVCDQVDGLTVNCNGCALDWIGDGIPILVIACSCEGQRSGLAIKTVVIPFKLAVDIAPVCIFINMWSSFLMGSARLMQEALLR